MREKHNIFTRTIDFINREYEACTLLLSYLLMTIEYFYDGAHGQKYAIIGFVPGIAISFFGRSKAFHHSKLLKTLLIGSLILGAVGMLIMHEYPQGGTPIHLKWMYTFTGQLFGVMVGGFARSVSTDDKEKY